MAARGFRMSGDCRTPVTVHGYDAAMGEQFADLYAEHLPAARRVALALVPADAADDIVAEAFTRVLARQAAGGGPNGAFRPYLLAAVRNLARDWLAERRRTSPAPIDPRAVRVPGAGELVTAAEELAMTRRAFASLPARWRAVLWQTEVEGRTPAQLSRASGMTPNAVAQLASRARVGLALAWQRERGPQERITGPVPALVRLAERKYRKTLDTSQADHLSLRSQAARYSAAEPVARKGEGLASDTTAWHSGPPAGGSAGRLFEPAAKHCPREG